MDKFADCKSDTEQFGSSAWIYCMQHLRPHKTGWCTVHNSNKVMLEARTEEQAYKECRHKKLPIYGETKNTK
jgi:hypothetical protein